MYPFYRIQDVFASDGCAASFSGRIDREIRIVIEGLYKKIDFAETVDMFRRHADLFAAGEFWGKLMRAACAYYAVTGDEALRQVLDRSMEDMLSVQAPDGEISCAPRETQPNGTHGSDLWERKYVLLGMLAYYEVFRSRRVLDAACALASYTCGQVGALPKTPVTETGWAFCGIESASILEPVVKLYGLTGRPEYMELARHIVEETGCCARENIFLAIEAGKSPKDVGSNGKPEESIAKAYEMMSCFEGLCEYYRATGNERWLAIVRKFYARLLEEEITLLGSGGADKPYNLGPGKGEQWNFTRYEQTNPDIELTMETCVTITWMKLCLQYLRLTGDRRAADEIERSYCNALSGALRPDGAFFDYFPRFNGVRGGRVNFTYDISGFPLSCCTANGPAGYAALASAAVMRAGDGAAVNLFFDGTYEAGGFTLRIEGGFPFGEGVRITVLRAPAGRHTLRIRIPGWCGDFTLYSVPSAGDNGWTERDGYALVTREWKASDEVRVRLPHTLRVVPAPHGSNRAGDGYFALVWGPLVMARDRRFDLRFDQSLPFPDTQALPCTPVKPDGVGAALKTRIGGEEITLVDYADAGGTWDDASAYRSWFPVAEK